jgi:hypothetical protein
MGQQLALVQGPVPGGHVRQRADDAARALRPGQGERGTGLTSSGTSGWAAPGQPPPACGSGRADQAAWAASRAVHGLWRCSSSGRSRRRRGCGSLRSRRGRGPARRVPRPSGRRRPAPGPGCRRCTLTAARRLDGGDVAGLPAHAQHPSIVSLGCGSGGQLREVGGGAPVDLGDRLGVVPQRGSAAAAMAEAGSGVPQVESRRPGAGWRWAVRP